MNRLEMPLCRRMYKRNVEKACILADQIINSIVQSKERERAKEGI